MRRADINMKALIAIIVVLLVFIVLAGFYLKIHGSILKNSDREVCKTSVLAQSVTINVPSGEKLVTPDCKTYNVVFFEDHVEINGKTAEVYDPQKGDYVSKFNSLTSGIVNSVVAEELRWCWYQFLEGQKKIFSRGGVVGQVQLSVPDLCFLCDEISFDSTVKVSEFTGFYDYLQSATMRNANMTYYDYLAEEPRICESYEDKPCWEEFFKDKIADETGWSSPDQTVMKSDSKYVVTFIKHGEEGRLIGTVGVGWRENYFAYIMPADSLSKRCDSLMRGSAK
ncbi:MAG TPA: hypothetical protein VJ461_06320 [Candidatus Nanoarchaeia archaeon]|nr:hypothetical protein [Candidatus Nanoarchaeia archaeon]